MIEDLPSIIFIAVLASITTLITQLILCKLSGAHDDEEKFIKAFKEIDELKHSIEVIKRDTEYTKMRMEGVSRLQDIHSDLLDRLRAQDKK